MTINFISLLVSGAVRAFAISLVAFAGLWVFRVRSFGRLGMRCGQSSS